MDINGVQVQQDDPITITQGARFARARRKGADDWFDGPPEPKHKRFSVTSLYSPKLMATLAAAADLPPLWPPQATVATGPLAQPTDATGQVALQGGCTLYRLPARRPATETPDAA